MLSPRFSDPANVYWVIAFVADSKYEYLYVTHRRGLSKISTTDWSRTLVTGLNDSSNEPDSIVNGPLLNARFDCTYSCIEN